MCEFLLKRKYKKQISSATCYTWKYTLKCVLAYYKHIYLKYTKYIFLILHI